MPAGGPQAWDRLLCPGEVQPSGDLWLQETWNLE